MLLREAFLPQACFLLLKTQNSPLRGKKPSQNSGIESPACGQIIGVTVWELEEKHGPDMDRTRMETVPYKLIPAIPPDPRFALSALPGASTPPFAHCDTPWPALPFPRGSGAVGSGWLGLPGSASLLQCR